MDDEQRQREIAALGVRQVTRLGDLLIDEETGEILEWPADAGADRLEYFGRQRAGARRQENAWRSIGGFYGRALLARMQAEQLERYEGETVRIAVRNGRDSRRGDPNKIEAVRKAFELTPHQTMHILNAATELSYEKLLHLEAIDILPAGVAAALMVGKIGEPYIIVDELRRAAPRLESELHE